MKSILLVWVCVILQLSRLTFAQDIDDYLGLYLSEEEKVALKEFRAIVRPYLTTSYMKKDIYLIRWLRARDLDVRQAEQMLLNNLSWRKANNIDTILTEDFSDMKDDYPYNLDTYDKRGRPVGTVNLGAWNILTASLTGRMQRLTRYMTKLLESSVSYIIDLQQQGNNVTQFTIIMNLDGFNGIQHTCPLCLPFYTSFVTSIQTYYTGYPYKVVLINTPIVFKAVLDLVQPLFTPRTKRVLKIFGNDKEQWMNYLDKFIAREERREEFGGTRKDTAQSPQLPFYFFN